MIRTIAIWVLRILAAGIMLQTLFFKFTASEESVYIFTTLGVEPWGRILSGVMELIASLLILMPRTTGFGAFLGIGVMAGALMAHIFILGIEVMADGGLLFAYALIVFISSLILVVIFKDQVLNIIFHKKTSKQIA